MSQYGVVERTLLTTSLIVNLFIEPHYVLVQTYGQESDSLVSFPSPPSYVQVRCVIDVIDMFHARTHSARFKYFLWNLF